MRSPQNVKFYVNFILWTYLTHVTTKRVIFLQSGMIIRHLRKAVLSTSTRKQKKSSSMRQADHRDVIKKDSKCPYINCWGIPQNACLLSHQLLQLWNFRKHSKGHWCPLTTSWRRYSNGMLLWLVVQPKYTSSYKKITCKNFGQCRCHMITQNIW